MLDCHAVGEVNGLDSSSCGNAIGWSQSRYVSCCGAIQVSPATPRQINDEDSCRTMSCDISTRVGAKGFGSALPQCLRDEKLPPSILFVTVDGISKLIDDHLEYLKKLVRDGSLTRIFIDEVHTLLAEHKFRQAYDYLWKLGAVGCTIVTLTGMLNEQLVPGLAQSLMLSNKNDASDMVHIKPGDPIGTGFLFDIHSVDRNLVLEVKHKVISFTMHNQGNKLHTITLDCL